MKKMKTLLTLTLILLLFMPIYVFAAKDVIKIGINLPLTGAKARFGVMDYNSIKMAFEKLGVKEINGRKIKFIVEDNGGKPPTARAAEEKLISLDKVDAATNLAKNNELQLLVFRISDSEDSAYYAINVFKTREVVESRNHYLTQIPSSHPLLEGTIILRGLQIPILNLPSWLGKPLEKADIKKSNILICDFNGIIIGLRIMSAYRVIKKNWSEMHAPDSYRLKEDGVIINDTRLEDGSLCLILDYEKLLADVIPQAMVDVELDSLELDKSTIPSKLQNGTVLIAEDSKTAQRALINIFKNAIYTVFYNLKIILWDDCVHFLLIP